MKSKAQLKFEEERKDLTDRELMLEILYANYLTYRSQEKTRSNTSMVVNFLVFYLLVGLVIAGMVFIGVN
jgi:hypothetical protein